MARKDVNLVIRARDQATRNLDKINDTLDEFRVKQGEIATSSGKTDKALSTLATTIDKVDRALGGLDNADKAAAQIDSAREAIARLQTEAKEQQATLSETRAEYRRVNGALTGYEKTLATYAARLDQSNKAQKEALATQRQATTAAKAAGAEQDRLTARRAKLPGLIERESAALLKAQTRYRELSAAMGSADKPSATLQKNFESSGNSVQRLQTRLDKLSGEFTEIDSKIAGAAKSLQDFTSASAKAESDAAANSTEIAKTSARYELLKKRISETQTELRGLGSAKNAGSNGLARTKLDAENAAKALVVLEQASRETDAVLSGLKSEGLGQIEKELVDQGIAVNRAKLDFVELREEYARLAAETARLGVPTRELSKDLQFAGQAADEAELKFLQQQETLKRMGAAFAGSEKDVTGLRSTMRAFAGEQSTTAAALNTLSNEGLEARNAIRALHVEASSGESRQFANEIRRAGSEADRTRPKISSLRQVYDDLYGGSRQALSINQRLRGEVLSLIATYGGFFAVINTLKAVTTAYQEIEAAQARLNVANNGDTAKTAADLDFLRRTADRLGVDLGTLSREYSKFGIAVQGTNLEGQRARDIFLGISEAARVSRSSNEELKGVFTALTQIVSKGAVQMEELRQQLGDRLPGAIQLMADGLGVTTAEMIKLMEQGRVTSDALVGFADQISDRFSGGLDDALESTSAELGRLQASAFQALLAFGEAGFLEEFTGLIKDLNGLLKSAEFTTFIQRISSASSAVLSTLRLIINNFELAATVVGTAIGLKMTRPILALIGVMGKWKAAMVTAAASSRALSASTTGMAASARGATGAIAGLRAGVTAFLASTGLGLFLAVGGALFANWISSASDANEALTEHQRILDEVKNAYDRVGGSVDEWAESLSDVTQTEAIENLRRLEDALEEASGNISDALLLEGGTAGTQFFGINLAGDATEEYQEAVRNLLQEIDDGTTPVSAMRGELDSLASTFRDGTRANEEYALQLDRAAKTFQEIDAKVEQARLIVQTFGDDSEEAAEALEALGGAALDAGGELEPITAGADAGSEALEKFNDSADKITNGLRGMLEEFPQFEDYLDRLEEKEGFAALRDDVVSSSLEILDLKRTWLEMQSTLEGTSFTGLFVDLLTDLDSVLAKVKGIGDSVGGLAGRFGDLSGTLSDAVGGFGNFLNQAVGNVSTSDDAGLEDLTNRLIIRESSGNPNAQASTSSAAGLGQFINETWLREFKKQFPNQAAEMTRQAILDLRFDPGVSFTMTRVAVDSYAQTLERSGFPVNASTVYASHFLGQQGALDILRADPQQSFADFNPRAAEANPAFADLTNQQLLDKFGAIIRGVTPEQVALAQSFNPNPVDKDSQPETPEFVQRLEATQETLDDNEFSIRQQGLINEGKERQSEIESAIRDARKDNPFIGSEAVEAIAQQTGKLYDLNEAKEAGNEADREREKLRQEAEAQQASTDQTLDDAAFSVRQQELINAGKERQAEIEAAIRSAKSDDPNISQAEIDAITARTSALFDLKVAQSGETVELKAAEEAQKRINELLSQRTAIEEQYQLLKDSGDFEGANAAQEEIKALNETLLEAITNAEAMWAAVGGDAAATATAQLGVARLEAEALANQGGRVAIEWDQVAGLFEGGLTNAFLQFAEAVANGESSFDAAKDAFRQFAGEFLLQIAQMIIQAAILGALQSVFGGTGFGALIGVGSGHTGGSVGSKRVGTGNQTRNVSPSVFAGAPRFHEGGVVGLRPGEVPIIAKEGEEIYNQNDPNHSSNRSRQGGGAAPVVEVTSINTFDAESFLEQALSTPAGQKIFYNFVSAKAAKVNAALNQ